MPLLPHTPTPIINEVSDRVYNGTTFKQKAQFVALSITQDEVTYQLCLSVKLKASLFANDNGNYGDEIIGKGITTYQVTLVADNNCAVNPQTGAVVYVRQNETLVEWMNLLASKEEPLMLQGDFFEYLMHSAPVEIEPLLRNFMAQADMDPFNKFAG